MTPKLFPFQIKGLEFLATRPRAMLSWSMGLGKTRVVIADRALRAAGKPTLWVCPAKVRRTIADEFALWAPEERVAVVDEDWNGRTAPVTITSYENLEKVATAANWAMVVYDESHYLKNWRAKRTQLARDIARHAPLLRLLSGTPAANEPIDIYGQLDIMHPWKWGKYQDFATRYCNVEANEYSPTAKVWGNNAANLPEFHARLAKVCHRVTKSEVAHLLPALSASAHYIRPTGRKNLTLAEALDGLQLKAVPRKIEAVFELIDGRTADDAFCVYTHLNATAEMLYEACRQKYPGHRLFLLPDVGRDAMLREAFEHVGPKILVSTYHKIAEGINNLVWAKCVIFAELDWQPAIMEQAFGRHQRLNSPHPVHIYMVVMEGTAEEAVSRVLLRKMQAGDELLGAGTEGLGAIAALTQDDFEDELARLSLAVQNRREVSDDA